MGENTAALKDMAAQLAAKLRVQGGGGMEEWSKLHRKLAQVAAAAGGDNPTTAVQALKNMLRENETKTSSSLAAGSASYSDDAQALMTTLEESFSKANPHLLKDLILRVADELNMTPLGDSEPVHMVNEDSNFCEENVDHIVKCSAELSAPDAPCAVISIVGAQSSGKSYLLNRLFGTRFPEMNAKLGRSRTTRGIMMSRCIGPSFLLLDFQGFIGREKGQDTLFQKSAAHFALYVSDLMLVNMSVFDIGREQGGATYLFRSIFEERMKLHSTSITKILVVLRFYDGETPIEILRSDVMRRLEKIWKSVNKETTILKEYIEVNVVSLPDKNSPDFPKEVTALRKLLSNNISAKVPASGFLLSSSMFWDTIKEKMELDIQRVAAARMYCRQLIEDILNSLDSQENYKLLKAEESPQHFKEISHELLGSLKTEYDLETEMYDPDVRDNERQYLVERLHKIFTYDSREVVWKVKENTLDQFKGEFDRNTRNMKEGDADLYGKQIVTACIEKFTSSCEELKLFDSEYLHRICEDLRNQMQSYTARNLFAINFAVARLHCQEQVEDTVQSLDSMEKYKLLKEEESPRRFKEISEELLALIMTEYELKTKMFSLDVRDKELQYLVKRLEKIFTYDSRELIWKVQENTFEVFKGEFARNMKNMIAADADLYAKQIMEACIEKFMTSCEDLKVFDPEYLHKMCEHLRNKMQSYTSLPIEEIKEGHIHAGKEDKKIKKDGLKGLSWPWWVGSGNIRGRPR